MRLTTHPVKDSSERSGASLIKGLGAYLKSRGLSTKLLLGDNSDATTYSFIDEAMSDSAALPFIGAISFHSWRGWEDSLLAHWIAAAEKIHVPLIVGEGSIDAAAWAYPQIFLEDSYAMDEINLYVRLMALCHPLSILQWQLTADYSPLTGGGIFGIQGPLSPTRRFWNLKQLSSTPKNLHYMTINGKASNISCVALKDESSSRYAVHLVNSGAARTLMLQGFPKNIRWLNVTVTDHDRTMGSLRAVPVSNGTLKITLPATSFISLMN